MKIVVTGGAGFIGSYLVDALVSEKVGEIWVLDNFYRGKEEHLGSYLQSEAVRLIEGDVRDEAILKSVFEKADLVYHLAAQSNVLGAISDLDYSFSTNVVGTFNVLRQAAKSGVSRVVFTSSREVYGEVSSLPVHEETLLVAKNPYGASKIAAEAYCRTFSQEDLEVVILRLANVYGPRDTGRVIPLFTNSLLRREPLVIFGENKVLDFVWVGDAVATMVQAGLRKDWIQEPVNIGTGIGISLVLLAHRLMAITGIEVEVKIAPAREFEVMGYVANIERMVAYFGNHMESDPLDHLEAVVRFWRRLSVGTRGDW